MKSFVSIAASLTFLLLISGCSPSFNVKQLAKGDIDFVADVHRNTVEAHSYTLMTKLYKRNPSELRKTPRATLESQRQQLSNLLVDDQPLLINGLEGIEILTKAFEPELKQDRVFMLVGGLLSMLHQSYGYKRSFYLFDSLDQQKLYHSARNIEVLAWRLKASQGANGKPLLLSHSQQGEVLNLSFARLLGKMIATQDMIAQIAADSSRRTINKVAHNVASFVFIPL